MRSVVVAILLFTYLGFLPALFAQSVPDKDTSELHHQYLPEITIAGRNTKRDVIQLPEVLGTSIYAGKKNALIILDHVKGNVVNNTMRQVMAKVPGIHIWESDGSGIQIGISARGLSPNRSWEFNVRQNGYDVSADPYGYPEAYYNPPLQAVQRIEIIRGHGSLQYGPQFGGLVNYIIRNGSDYTRPLQGETHQTVGSNGLFNTYMAAGGHTSRFHYYTFYDQRSAAGWRRNSAYVTRSGYATFTYHPFSRLTLTTELMYSHMNSQQPGGLTDSQVQQDSRHSLRQRNWMDLTWVTGAILASYSFSAKGKLDIRFFSVTGDRNSVGFLRPITVSDSILPQSLAYANRTVDIDKYRNAGMEARLIRHFMVGERQQTFSGGIRLYTGTTSRFRDGKGTGGSRYEMQRVDPRWPREIDFTSKNAAIFAEQLLRLSGRFLLVPGFRYEYLKAEAGGIDRYDLNGDPVFLSNEQRKRGFLLWGVGAEYHTNDGSEVYANITRAYRPIQFADLTVPPTTDEVDPSIKDATGFNADLGYRGKWKDILYFDISAFLLRYNDRIGVITQQRANGTFYNYRTNVGNSHSRGIEAYTEVKPLNLKGAAGNAFDLSLFISYAYTQAVYDRFQVIAKNGSNELIETDLRNNWVENAPRHILRAGTTITYKKYTLTYQHSTVSGAFSDANNTWQPSANAQIGWIPGYAVSDVTFTGTITSLFQIRAGVNNVFNERYFTRRSSGYPGPGALPADGRSVFISVIVKSK